MTIFNYLKYVWEPNIHERVRDPTSTRGSETKRENEAYDEVRCLGASEERKVTA